MTEYCDWCHNAGHSDAFLQLLAVAKEAWDHRDDACRVPHTALDVALALLDVAHPGWREWM